MPLDSEKTELGSSNQEASPSARKNTGIVALVSCHGWNCVPTVISGVVDISEVPGCHLLQQIVHSEGHKNCFTDWCIMNSQPTFLFLTYFYLNELWPYYQKDVNQVVLNHTTL